MWLCEYLEILQSACNERLTRCLLPVKGKHILHGLLKSLSLGHQVSRLHHYQQHVLHLNVTSGLACKHTHETF